MSTWDVDRSLSREAKRSWTRCVVWKHDVEEESRATLSLGRPGLAEELSTFLGDALLIPDLLYLKIFPPAPPAPVAILPSGRRQPGRPPVPQRAVVEDDTTRNSESEEENEDDRRARLRAGALGGIKWLLGLYFRAGSVSIMLMFPLLDTYPDGTPNPEWNSALLHRMLSNPITFTALHSAQRPATVLPPDQVGFGYGQPMVRRAAWAVVQALAVPCRGMDFRSSCTLED